MARLDSEYQSRAGELLTDPHSYRYWQPTGDDWRKLFICQAMWAHDSKHSEPALLVPRPKKARGRPKADMWTRARFVNTARHRIASRESIPVTAVSKKAASIEAEKLIKKAARAGDWRGAIPTAATIEEAWSDLHIEDDGTSPELPAWMEPFLEGPRHLAEIERVADKLGMARNLPTDYTEFASWAFGRVDSADRLPGDLTSWADYNRHLDYRYGAEVLRAKGLTPEQIEAEILRGTALYRDLLDEFEGLTS